MQIVQEIGHPMRAGGTLPIRSAGIDVKGFPQMPGKNPDSPGIQAIIVYKQYPFSVFHA